MVDMGFWHTATIKCLVQSSNQVYTRIKGKKSYPICIFLLVFQMFSHCHRLVQQIRSRSLQGKQLEQKMAQNIVSSLARSLQEMSSNFRRSQSAYLKSKWKKDRLVKSVLQRS